jgi:hypothetical protein
VSYEQNCPVCGSLKDFATKRDAESTWNHWWANINRIILRAMARERDR